MRVESIRSWLTEHPDRLAARLCGVGTACMALTFLAANLGPTVNASGPQTVVYFRFPLEVLPFGFAFLALAVMPLLVLWTLFRRRARIWPVLGWTVLSTAGFVGALGFLMVSSLDDFAVEDFTRGADGRTYYFLRCPPPLNGPGDYLVARRVNGNPLFYTVVTLGSYRRGGEFLPFEPANPTTLAVARTLWNRFERNNQAWSRR